MITALNSRDLELIIDSNPELFSDYVDIHRPVYWLCVSADLRDFRGYYIVALCPFIDVEDSFECYYRVQEIGYCSRECYKWLKARWPNNVYRR